MQSPDDFKVGKQYKFTGGDAIYTCIAKTPTGRPVLHYVYSNDTEESVFIPSVDSIYKYIIECLPEKWVNLYWNHDKSLVYVGATHSSRDALDDSVGQYIMTVKVQ